MPTQLNGDIGATPVIPFVMVRYSSGRRGLTANEIGRKQSTRGFESLPYLCPQKGHKQHLLSDIAGYDNYLLMDCCFSYSCRKLLSNLLVLF